MNFYKTGVLLVVACCVLMSSALWAKSAQITGVRIWDSPDSTRLVFDLSKPIKYEVFSLKKPNRIVVDFNNSKAQAVLPGVSPSHELIRNIRSGARKKKSVRFVLDMKKIVKPHYYSLLPNKEYGHRLVIDLNKTQGLKNGVKKPTQLPRSEPSDNQSLRDIVIAIDAGHGGEDPGARGKRGTKEKDVVLRIAKRLAKLIEQTPGMTPVVIRTGDYYLSLRKRIQKARRHKADLFISIHADAFKNTRVKGSSVYVLSARGASDEAAKWLAKRENAADLIGGVSLEDKDDVLASVLLDLSMNGTIDVSTRVANKVLREFKKIGPVHKQTVQHAGFVVLKSPDIPSLLIETAFISNPREERRLRDKRYQQKLANAMMRGIHQYFIANPPPGTLLAQGHQVNRIYHVKRGDTLSSIAGLYQVSVPHLKRSNQMTSNRLRVGETLTIPF